MRRRDFITLLGAATLPSPLVAQAQQSARVRRIAVLMNNAEDDPEGQARAAAFRQGLQALGWTDGSNVRIDWYWTAGDIGRIRSDVIELARDAPDIIVANGRVILSEAVQVIRSNVSFGECIPDRAVSYPIMCAGERPTEHDIRRYTHKSPSHVSFRANRTLSGHCRMTEFDPNRT